MEALAAVSLAGNILGFIDFAWKLLATTHTIYHSVSDSTPENRVLDVIARDVESHCENLLTHDASPQLNAVAKESREIAKELQSQIEKIRGKSKGSRWGSFMTALHGVMNKGEISALVERLSNLNKRITTHLLQSMVTQQNTLSQKFDDIEIRIDGSSVMLDEFKASLRRDLEKAAGATRDREAEVTQKLNQCIELLKKWEENGTTQFEAALTSENRVFSPLIEARNDFILYYALQGTRDNLVLHYQITKTLEFDDMWSREGQIDEAHAETFKWVLHEPEKDVSFVQWLENGNSTYWIQGKPGAGKSTLMKYICQQAKTYQYLERWAQGNSLITARYFSWFAGTDLQRSQEGLLRSLLFHVFTKNPRSIRDLDKAEYGMVKNDLRTGLRSVKTLMRLLRRLVEETPTMRYCFFIDGLDEFIDPHADLIEMINSLAKYKNLKLCVSNRPLSHFTDAYGNDPEAQLKVENLTLTDIQSFVADKLNANKPFQTKVIDNPWYQTLMTQPVEKSNGVFLWVVLIVRSLLEGLTNGDSTETLELRFAEFPEDLGESLAYILESVEERYKREAAEAFRIALVCEDAMPLLLFSALFEKFEMKNKLEWPLKFQYQPHSRKQILDRHRDARRRLDARCKGLLEVVELPRDPSTDAVFTVSWLHRCVKEFLKRTEEIEKILRVKMKDGTNARLLICGAYLRVTKWLPDFDEDYIMSYTFDRSVIHPFCTMADKLYRYEPDPLGVSATESDVQMLHAIISQLEITLQERWPTYNWRLMYMALDLDWKEYIEYRMDADSSIMARVGGNLLAYTLGVKGHDPNLAHMKMLLDHGANPNEQLRAGGTQTPWTAALTKYMWMEGRRRKFAKDCDSAEEGDLAEQHMLAAERDLVKIAGAIKLLAAHGADPNASIRDRYLDDIEVGITARELVEKHLLHPDLEDIRWATTEAMPEVTAETTPEVYFNVWFLLWLVWLRGWMDWAVGSKTKQN
ncbi:hypothetical protein E0Z10_g8538 [Xylaria hypoxylon]|uniref:Uncharacterized protein n=1 Tax=Xylaria hypoxylon TaxID=37992 RepID=A0A4Z0YNN5_9PEZI|nr:hypothetical protein E0Z10_g8538 [Xylaria hypoxylon]